VSGQQRVRRQARQDPYPKRQPGPAHRADRNRLGGADYFTRPDNPDNERRKAYLIRELQAMDVTVTITPAA
jgi:hypothetical protein